MFILAGQTQIRNPMKAIIFFLSIAFAGYTTAQNWSPIFVNEKMNYQHSDSSYISNTIWVDSVETACENLIYHLNRVVKDVPDNPEIVLRNQHQFLLKQMEATGEGIYTFSYPGEFTIKTLANPGEIWIFNLENNITAEVNSISVEDVFGVQDSVKVISLSDGNEIRLSKSFGILKFPDFENGGNYDLVGIQNTEYGESVPDFWDIFDFEVGDVFQYNGFESNIDFTLNWIKKIIITLKEMSDNSYFYEYDGIYYGIGYDNIFPPDPFEFGDSISGSMTYIDSLNHLVNSFPNQLHVFPNSFSTYGSGKVYTSAIIIKNEETNLASKHFGFHYSVNYEITGELYYEQEENSEILYKYEPPAIIDEPCFTKGKNFGELLGEIYYVEGCFEYQTNMSLEGYIKNGDTVGIITPDSLLLVGLFETRTTKSTIIVFPNPADKYVQFKFSSGNDFKDCSIEIRNLLGEAIIKVKRNEEIQTLDIRNLKPGIYFYTIKSKGMIIQQGKLVIQ
jgi:hypothetical protein